MSCFFVAPTKMSAITTARRPFRYQSAQEREAAPGVSVSLWLELSGSWFFPEAVSPRWVGWGPGGQQWGTGSWGWSPWMVNSHFLGQEGQGALGPGENRCGPDLPETGGCRDDTGQRGGPSS